MRTLYLIPARGGSVEVPGKNLVRIRGVTLLRRAIDAGLYTRTINGGAVVVSTDDLRIQEHALMFCDVVRRSPETSGDVRIEKVILEALKYPPLIGIHNICLLQPSAPFHNLEAIAQGVEAVSRDKYDTAISVIKCQHEHPSYILDDKGVPVLGAEGYAQAHRNRQELPTFYRRCSHAYFATVNHYKKFQSFYSDRMKLVEIEKPYDFNIDTPDDLKEARRIATERGI